MKRKTILALMLLLCVFVTDVLTQQRYKINRYTGRRDYYEPATDASLGDLDNVTISALASGMVLHYNGSAWVNTAVLSLTTLTSATVNSTNLNATTLITTGSGTLLAVKDTFAWNTNSRYKMELAQGMTTTGHGASFVPGRTITNTINWEVYDLNDFNLGAEGYAGAVFDGRYIYYIPQYHLADAVHGLIARYDTTGDFSAQASWTIFDITTVDSDAVGFHGAVFDGRYIYLVPNSAGAGVYQGHVARYDTTADFEAASSWAVYDTSVLNAECVGFIGAVFDGRYVYFVPFYTNTTFGSHIPRYDTTADFETAGSWSVFDMNTFHANAERFQGAVFDGRYIYFAPYGTAALGYSGFVTRYDTTASFTTVGSWTIYDISAVDGNAKGFAGIVFDGRYVYLVPYKNFLGYSGIVPRYDIEADFETASSWTTIDLQTIDADAEGYFGAVFDGRYIYFVPYWNNTNFHGNIAMYDTTQSFSDSNAWTIFDVATFDIDLVGFLGGIFDGRYFYLTPFATAGGASYSGHMSRYDTGSTQPMSGIHHLAKTDEFYIDSAGNITSATWNATVIDAIYGGTNIASYIIGDLIYADGVTSLAKLADVAVGSYLASGGVGVAPSWATLNQAAVAGLTTGSSPVFVTTKLSGLTDGYFPYHVNDATGLADSVIYTDGTNVGIGVGASSASSKLHIKANTPGVVGNNQAGQLIIQDPDDTVFGNAVITGYESDVSGNPDQQLWYLGSHSASNSNIVFLNRRNSDLYLGTNDIIRMTIDAGGDIYTVAWADYGGTSTVVGFSGTPTVNIWYKKIGNFVYVNFYISGTSDDTPFTFTLPYTNVNDTNSRVYTAIKFKDNNAQSTVSGQMYLAPNTDVVALYTDWAAQVWTPANTKEAMGHFWYEAQ